MLKRCPNFGGLANPRKAICGKGTHTVLAGLSNPGEDRRGTQGYSLPNMSPLDISVNREASHGRRKEGGTPSSG